MVYIAVKASFRISLKSTGWIPTLEFRRCPLVQNLELLGFIHVSSSTTHGSYRRQYHISLAIRIFRSCKISSMNRSRVQHIPNIGKMNCGVGFAVLALRQSTF